MTFDIIAPFKQAVQGTPEWHAARLGKATASRIADITARTKTGPGASRANYLAELVTERLTGVPVEGFKSAAMLYGQEMEPEARKAYAEYQEADILEVGFIDHQRIAMAGASPDGVVLNDQFQPVGLVEIKCVNTSTHIDMLINESIPRKYLYQMQWQMAVTGAPWCDFVSYDNRMPPRHRLYTVRIERDQELITTLEKEVIQFLYEVEATIRRLDVQYMGK